MNTCTLKTAIKVPYRARTIELLVPCELPPGHLGRCDAAKLQAAALNEPEVREDDRVERERGSRLS